jgi:hypothetical protein
MGGLTKEDFERGYCERSGITLELYRQWSVTLPCACDYEGCEGWAAVSNDPDLIADHKKFNSP